MSWFKVAAAVGAPDGPTGETATRPQDGGGDTAKWAGVAYMALSRLPQKTESDLANMDEIKKAFPAMIGLMTVPRTKPEDGMTHA
jgi:hypothetical protein